jgi:3-hydroxybutyrate dehydrogenase
MFKGKTVLVTGSTSGIGLGIATRFAAGGANVVLNGFGDAKEIEQLRKNLSEKNHVSVVYDAADMSKADAIAAMIKGAIAEFGAIDILVNNAGIQHVAPVDDFPVARWDAILAINLSAAFHTVRAALPAMKKKGWGRIVNIASVAGLQGAPYVTAYTASKHALVGLTRALAAEVAGKGVTVNAVCPGFAATDIAWNGARRIAARTGRAFEEAVAALAQLNPGGRLVEPAEVAAVVLRLVGDEKITGDVVVLDGTDPVRREP